MEAAGEGGMLTMKNKKAEIDTSPPFRSVKEAVLLFGERVLAGEVYTHNLKQMHEAASDDDDQVLKAELQETKESLQKAREESMVMATCLSSLQEELERTKRELQQLKQQESEKQVVMEPDIEDLKFIEHSPNYCQVKTETSSHEKTEFQKKRYVTFANHPSVAQVMVPSPSDHAVLKRHPSLKKKKKKPLIPLMMIGGFFSRKKGSSEVA